MSEPIDLEQIEARTDIATAGPWELLGSCIVRGTGGTILQAQKPGDALFAAWARQDVPALIAEVRDLRAELAELDNAGVARLQEWLADRDRAACLLMDVLRKQIAECDELKTHGRQLRAELGATQARRDWLLGQVSPAVRDRYEHWVATAQALRRQHADGENAHSQVGRLTDEQALAHERAERARAHELLDQAERIIVCVGGREPTDADVAEWVASWRALAGRAVPGVDQRFEHRVRTAAAAEEPLDEWERELLAEQVPGAGDAGGEPVRRFDDGEPQRRCSFICNEHAAVCEASEPRPWHDHDRHYHIGARCDGGWETVLGMALPNAYCGWDRGSHQPHRFGDPVHWCDGVRPRARGGV